MEYESVIRRVHALLGGNVDTADIKDAILNADGQMCAAMFPASKSALDAAIVLEDILDAEYLSDE